MSHPLHLCIGNFLRNIVIPIDCKLLLAPECGGNHNLPLFCCPKRSNETEYCNVDMLLLKDNRVRLILEIEESGFLPTKICGKFLTSVLSTNLIHDLVGVSDMSIESTFIQVMDSCKFPAGTSKLKQARMLESSLQSILPIRSFTMYRMFDFAGPTGFAADQDGRTALAQLFLTACS